MSWRKHILEISQRDYWVNRDQRESNHARLYLTNFLAGVAGYSIGLANTEHNHSCTFKSCTKASQHSSRDCSFRSLLMQNLSQ